VSHYLAISEGKIREKEEEKVNRIVFIGKGLKATGCERMLRQCLFRNKPKSKDILK